VTGNAATLNGALDPNGFQTTYRFEYGTTTSYGTSVPVRASSVEAGMATIQASQTITGLAAGTTYHYRLVATSSADTGKGADRAFRTAAPAVTGRRPAAGLSGGGTDVTISGRNFVGVTAVKFGQSNAESFKVESEGTIAAVSPPGSGIVDVTVTTSAGISALGVSDQFFYSEPETPFPTKEELAGAGESGGGEFGVRGVALSEDGSTAMVGAPGDDSNRGAAWVFTRAGATWTQQGEKLTGGGGKELFGADVALSADGNTALVSGTGNNDQATAWIFTRSGSTWTEQAELTGGSEAAGGEGRFWVSVALSADGDTAIIGDLGANEDRGAAWVFTRSGSTWTQQGEELTGAGEESGELVGGLFGADVALSADGNTALIGGNGDDAYRGAAWMFTRSGTTWTQQGEKLTGGGEIQGEFEGEGEFGYRVALSDDGNTALIGGFGNNLFRGAAWVFTRAGATWTQQAELTGRGEPLEFFGYSVALSGNGETALIHGSYNAVQAAALIYTRSGSTWHKAAEAIAGGGEEGEPFGSSMELSGEDNVALVGASGSDGEVGREWIFAADEGPSVAAIEPHYGPEAGGTEVTIAGTHFNEAESVEFGASKATSFEVLSETEIKAVSPSGAGTVAVTVTTPQGTSAIGPQDQLTYVPAPTVTKVEPSSGTETGGAAVTISGEHLGGASEVRFGGTLASDLEVTSATELTVKSPPHVAGQVNVTVTTPGGSSATGPADAFTYDRFQHSPRPR
jgi:IPT/TIG domain